MDKKNQKTTTYGNQQFPTLKRRILFKRASFLTLVLILMAWLPTMAQTQINTAIDKATTQVGGIFDSVSSLILVVGAVVGLAGGIRVFIKWQNGDQDLQKHIVGWMGACIFLLLVGVILKTFFGL